MIKIDPFWTGKTWGLRTCGLILILIGIGWQQDLDKLPPSWELLPTFLFMLLLLASGGWLLFDDIQIGK